MLDGLGGPPAEGEVWIVSGRIVEPGSARMAREESLAGRVVAPGLVDMHVHLCLDGGSDPLGAFSAAGPEELARLMREHAERTLLAGVTTVRDLGSPTGLVVSLRDDIAAGSARGPRIVASGAPITSPGGHLHQMGIPVRGPDAARAAVQSLQAAGVDVIKIVATGGGSSPQTDPRACQFTDDEMAALGEEARRLGLPVACHAHADAGVRQAVAAGMQTIEHGSFVSPSTLEAMAARRIAFVPTLAPAIHAGVLRPADPGRVPTRRMAAVGERWEARRAAVRAALECGVLVVVGSDAGVADTPHGGVVTEILALHACGMSPALAMAAAGRVAAGVLGIPDIGILTPGAHADLVVLEDDPLVDLTVLARPLAVMQAGRWVRPPAP
ncbi:MAG: amidohydrolase family protein [Armatimonadota bacterium]|nr:amidohydrolase family protein [Armatimonadota bacterium]